MTTGTPGRAVVTGASNGIGLELAKLLAAEGHSLVLAAEGPGLDDVAAGVRAAAPELEVETVAVDLATAEGVDELVRRIGPRGVDVAVVNAGIGLGGRFVGETELETGPRSPAQASTP